MHERDKSIQKETDDWNKNELVVEFLGRRLLVHQKIKLDIGSGVGSFNLT